MPASDNLLKNKTSEIYHTYLYAGTPYIGKKGYRDYLVSAPDTSYLASLCVYVTCDKNVLSALNTRERHTLIREGRYEKGNIVYHCYPYKDEYLFYYVDHLQYIYYYILPFMRNRVVYVNGEKKVLLPLNFIPKNKLTQIEDGDIKAYESMVIVPFDTVEWYYKTLKLIQGKHFTYATTLSYSSVHSSYSILHPFGRKLPSDIKNVIVEHVKEHIDKHGTSTHITKSAVILRFSEHLLKMSERIEQDYVTAMKHKKQGETELYEKAMQQHQVHRQQFDNLLNYLYNVSLHQDTILHLGKALLHHGSSHILPLYPFFNLLFYVNNVDHILSLGNDFGSDIYTKDILFHPIEEVVHSVAESIYQRYKEYKNKNTNLDEYLFYNLHYNRFYISTGYFYTKDFIIKNNAHNIQNHQLLPSLCVSTYQPRESKIFILTNKDVREQYHIAQSFIQTHRNSKESRQVYQREGMP